MHLYSTIYTLKKAWTEKKQRGKRDLLISDFDTYTTQFKNRYAHMLKTQNSHPLPAGTILFFSPMNLSYCMQIESIMAQAMQELGFKPVFVTTYNAKPLSDRIHRKIYGFKDILYMEDFMRFAMPKGANAALAALRQATTVEKIKRVTFQSAKIGIHALASFTGELPRGKATFDTYSMNQLVRYARASCKYVAAAEKIISTVNPLKILAVEKGFVSTCEIFYAAINRSVDYIQWLSCHEPNSIMLKRYHKENYRAHPFSVSDQTWSAYKNTNEDRAHEVLELFHKGYVAGDWFRYKHLTSDKRLLEKTELIKKFNLDPQKKIAIIFAHILNDTNFYYGDDIFTNGFPEWLVETVRAASKNPHVNWLLKLHPANVYRRKNQGYTGEYGEIIEIKEALGKIPDNITIIPADIEINPYSFFMIADYGITVRGTIGAELPCFGIPVLTAGTGRYSARGFTLDSANPHEYLEKIKNIHLIKPLTEEEKTQAIKHAYLFFTVRPAQYTSFMHDIYPFPAGHPLRRDVEITDPSILRNETLQNIVRFIAYSKDEDYLADKRY